MEQFYNETRIKLETAINVLEIQVDNPLRSTKQELAGASLNEFLLKKSGKTWDDVIEPRATFDDRDESTFSAFMKMSFDKNFIS